MAVLYFCISLLVFFSWSSHRTHGFGGGPSYAPASTFFCLGCAHGVRTPLVEKRGRKRQDFASLSPENRRQAAGYVDYGFGGGPSYAPMS